MSQPYLELQLHLTNGQTHHFVQADPELAGQIIRQINAKLFAQPSLIITDDKSVVAYATSALAGLSFVMEPLPDELLEFLRDPEGHVAGVWEITEDEFRAKLGTLKPIVEGESLLMLSAVVLHGGHHIWIENHVKEAVSAMQERHIVHQFFNRPLLPCRKLENGLSLWNRAQIISFSFHPNPSAPANAWRATRVED